MTMEEFLADIEDLNAKTLAGLYLPVISRWAAIEGWDVVRQWLYTFSDTTWQVTIFGLMTVQERRADDERRLVVVRQLGGDNAKRIIRERALLQQILTSLFTVLLSKL